MKYLLMALGCYSIIVGLYFDSTAENGSPVSLFIGASLGILLMFGGIVLALFGNNKK